MLYWLVVLFSDFSKEVMESEYLTNISLFLSSWEAYTSQITHTNVSKYLYFVNSEWLLSPILTLPGMLPEKIS